MRKYAPILLLGSLLLLAVLFMLGRLLAPGSNSSQTPFNIATGLDTAESGDELRKQQGNSAVDGPRRQSDGACTANTAGGSSKYSGMSDPLPPRAEGAGKNDSPRAISRDELYALEIRKVVDSYDEQRLNAKEYFGFANWPPMSSGLKPGFKFDRTSLPELADFSELAEQEPRNEQWDTNALVGSCNWNGVWWGTGHKVGVQRFFFLKRSNEHLLVSVFVGHLQRDAHIHLIDTVATLASSGTNSPTVFTRYEKNIYAVGDVNLTCKSSTGVVSEFKFVRGNIYVSLSYDSRAGSHSQLSLINIASAIDSQVKQIPDVSVDEFDLLCPEFHRCSIDTPVLLVSDDSQRDDPRAKTTVRMKVVDPRGSRIFMASAFSLKGTLVGGNSAPNDDPHARIIAASPQCATGAHSLWFTAINENLLFSVWECRVLVDRR